MNPTPPALPIQKTSGLAITSLVLGITGVICCSIVTGIPAVICGHIARGKIKRDPMLSGRGLALAGLILGYLSIALLPISAAVMLPAVTGAVQRAQMTEMLSEAKQIHLAMQQMALDGKTTGDRSKGLPADAGIQSVKELKERLVQEGYLSAERAEALRFDQFLFGNVSLSDGDGTVVIRSKPGSAPDGGIVFMQINGLGRILTERQAQRVEIVDPPRSPSYLSGN